jgi:hypothetical protein
MPSWTIPMLQVRPKVGSEDPETAFVHYICEKIHLLKRHQA